MRATLSLFLHKTPFSILRISFSIISMFFLCVCLCFSSFVSFKKRKKYSLIALRHIAGVQTQKPLLSASLRKLKWYLLGEREKKNETYKRIRTTKSFFNPIQMYLSFFSFNLNFYLESFIKFSLLDKELSFLLFLLRINNFPYKKFHLLFESFE